MQRIGIDCAIDFLSLTVRRQISSLIPAERGASAIEFALLAPVLIIALLGTVDVGRAVTEQMTMGSLLRTAAQGAITGGGVSKINQILQAANDDASVAVKVEALCACPENPQLAVDCSATCAGLSPTAIYYSLTATKTFSGMFLPSIPLSRAFHVQVR